MIFSLNGRSQHNIYKADTLLMGVGFEFAVVADSPSDGKKYLKEAIDECIRIENLISSWKTTSQTSLLNRNAGIRPIKVDHELFELIRRSKRISDLTDGVFDISFASIDQVWKFDGSMKKAPTEKEIQESIKNINYKNIILDYDNRTVFLKQSSMKIGFGAIGKGYCAEMVKTRLQKIGVKAGLINASGDIVTWGEHPQNDHWNIAITHPILNQDNFGWFKLKNNAVVTSGNYKRYTIIGEKKYAHIINPKTGYPADELSSVTVFTANAEIADALATSVFILGAKDGLDLIDQLKGIEALLIDLEGKFYYSKGLKIKENEKNEPN